jgi:hypothetical protein
MSSGVVLVAGGQQPLRLHVGLLAPQSCLGATTASPAFAGSAAPGRFRASIVAAESAA